MNTVRSMLCVMLMLAMLASTFFYNDVQVDASRTNVPVLLVDDDGGREYEGFYESALAASGFAYDEWNIYSQGRPSFDILSAYSVVVWFTGDEYFETLTYDDQSNLARYLDNKGALFISGQDIGYELTSNGTIPNTLFNDYFHARFISDSSGTTTVVCNGSEPICDPSGFASTLELDGGSGASNQATPSKVSPIGGAVSLMKYAGLDDSCAIKYDGVYKLVYFSFGFEGISEESQRNVLMQRIITYLGYGLPERGILIDAQELRLGNPGDIVTHNVTITNVATGAFDDVFELSLVSSAHDLPLWSFTMLNGTTGGQIMDTDGDGMNDTGVLSPGESFELKVNVMLPYLAQPGEDSYISFEVYSSASSYIRRSFTLRTSVAQRALLVDDDAGTVSQYVFAQMLTDLSVAFDTWEVSSQGAPSSEILQRYDLVAWICSGAAHVTLTEEDQNSLASYLDNGGRLFIEGVNIAYELTSGGTSHSDLLERYLNCTYEGEHSEYDGKVMVGRDDDPIGQYLPCLPVTGGALLSPIAPASAPFAFDSSSGYAACVRVDKGYRAVFMSAQYFEGPGALSMKRMVFGRIVAWLTSMEHFTFESHEGGDAAYTYSKPGGSANITVSLKNLGTSDIFDITFASCGWGNISKAEKNGITFELTDNNGNGIIDTGIVTQNAFVNLTFSFSVPSNANAGDCDVLVVKATSESHLTEKALTLTCASPRRILLVTDANDDPSPRAKYESALSALSSRVGSASTDSGFAEYDLWDVPTLGAPSLETLESHSVVIWTTGDVDAASMGEIDSSEAQTIVNFIEDGGRLLLSGSGIASAQTRGGSQSSVLLEALGCNFTMRTFAQYASGTEFDGLGGSVSLPIWGMHDVLTTTSVNTTSFLDYDTGGSAGVRFSSGNARSIFFTCSPIEGPAEFGMKVNILEKCLKWLEPFLDSRFALGPDETRYIVAGNTTKFNVTLSFLSESYDSDIFNIMLDATPGWNASVTLAGAQLQDNDGNGKPDTGTIAPMHSITLEVCVTASSSVHAGDRAFVKLVANSSLVPGIEERVELEVRAPQRILLVDDDGGRAYENSFKSALSMSGYEYDFYEVESEGWPDAAVLQGHRIVVWFTSECVSGTLTSRDQAMLASYLDNGGRLLISGQDICYDLTKNGQTSSAFLSNYLGIGYISDNSQGRSVKGITGDPISGGMLAMPFAGSYPEALDAVVATPFLVYDNGYVAGTRYASSSFRTAMLGNMYFEGQDVPSNKTALMDALIRWLDPSPAGVTVQSDSLGLGRKGVFVNYTISIRNVGNSADTFEIFTEINGTWDHMLTHSMGLPVADTDGDGTPDTGAINPSSAKALSLVVFVPASALPGDQAIFRLVVRSSNYDGCHGAFEITTRVPRTLLLVDDSGLESAEYAGYYGESLDAGSWGYDLWQVCKYGSPAQRVVSSYIGVIWFTGDDYTSTLTPSEMAMLETYVNMGGKLLLSGQDIGYDIGDTRFYRSFLGANYSTDAVTTRNVIGTANLNSANTTRADLSGLSFNITGGEGANNQHYPSGVTPNAPAFEAMRYRSTPYSAAVACVHAPFGFEVGKTLYLPFGLEGVSTSSDRAELMNRSLVWLLDVSPKLVGTLPFVRTYEDVAANGAFNPNFIFYDVSGALSFTYSYSSNLSVRPHEAGAVDIIPSPQWSGYETIRITAVDRWGSTASVDLPILVIPVNDPPIVTVLAPNGGESLSGITEISWNATDIDSTELFASVYVKRSSGEYELLETGISATNYAWDTRTVPNGEYMVRVVVSDGNMNGEDTSDGTFMVCNVENNHAPIVMFTSPSAGEVMSGSSSFVQWSASDPDGDHLSYKLEYRKGNGTWTSIADGISNVFLFQWDTMGLPNGYDYQLRITAFDGMTTTTAMSGQFTIKNPSNNRAPSVAFTYPANNAKLSSNATIVWAASDPDGDPLTYRLEISTDGTNWVLISTITNATFYKLDTTRFTDGRYWLQITADEGMKLASDQRIVTIGNLANVPPSARIVEPSPSSGINGICKVKWNASDTNSDPIFIRIELAAYGAEQWTILGAGWLGILANPLSFDTTTFVNGMYSLRIVANDSHSETVNVTEPVLIRNNHVPSLFDGEVSPVSGTEDTPYTFRVKYNDTDGDAPAFVKVIIDDESVLMRPAWLETELNYRLGILYYATVYLTSGTHSYYFTTSDGNGGFDTLSISELSVASEIDARITLALVAFLLAAALGMILFDGSRPEGEGKEEEKDE